jgi:hypothetical protein
VIAKPSVFLAARPAITNFLRAAAIYLNI